MTKKKQKRERAKTRNDKQRTLPQLEREWRTPAHQALRAERRARREAPSCFR
jgi:hypothetical protein